MKDAERWGRTIESEMDRGVFIDRSEAEATTLKQALERYLLEVTEHKKGKTKESSRIDAWLNHPLAKRSLASLKGKDFAAYRDERLKEASSGTVLRDLSIISNLFTVAASDWGMGLVNPLNNVRKPKPGKARSRRLEGDEYSRLLEACQQSKNPQLAPLFVLAVETSMRLSELLGMHWPDVDLAGRSVKLEETKNGSSRIVPLSTKAVDTLLHIPCSALNSKRVFYSWGQRSDAIKGSWVRACKRAGVADFHFHDNRHEGVSRLFEKGFHPIEVASISGHKSMQMLKRYTHLRPEDLLQRLG